MKRSRLQELADLVREHTDEKEKMIKDHKKILAGLERVNEEIKALENERKEVHFALSCSEAALVSKDNQLQAAKNRISQLVNNWEGGAVMQLKDAKPYDN